MRIDRSKIKKILMITLSNIGDVVLTLPVLGVLKREFPEADITVMVGPNAEELFKADPSVSEIMVYNKHIPFPKKVELAFEMRRRGFDMVIDLRNSLFPLLIGPKYSTPLFRRAASHIHRKEKHLRALSAIGIPTDNAPFSIAIDRDDKLHCNSVLNEIGILPDDNMVAMAAGARSHIKQWTRTSFVRLADRLTKEAGLKILLIGDEIDSTVNEEIAGVGLKEVYDLSGRTNLRELAYLLSLCKLLITNDSAPMHIASAMSLPTVAIFGPTDHKKYAPLAANSIVIRKKLNCAPCEKAACRFDLECMKEVSAEEVFKAVKEILLNI